VPIESYLKKLRNIYETMDRAYGEAMAFYGFDCNGCQDNCCRTHFFHYTIAEYLFLIRGFSTLEGGLQEEIVTRAQEMSDSGQKENYLCPLNLHGRCLLYPYRAMICRLHGLPFEVQRPDGLIDEGPGCERFEKEGFCRGLPYRRIDRTPFYRDLANLEREIRQEIQYPRKFKLTIAEMLKDGQGEEDVWRILKAAEKGRFDRNAE